MAAIKKNKQKRRKHLNEVPVSVQLRQGYLRILIKIPWGQLGRRKTVRKKILSTLGKS
jgi:hypothetical protein